MIITSSAELSAVLKAKNEAESEVNSFRGGLEGIERSFLGISPASAAAGLAIGATVGIMVGLTKAAYELGQAFDDSFDRIAIKSGATGQALEQLQEDFKAVVAGVPSSFEDAATAIGLLNARTGQSGESLQRLAVQLLTLSRLTGTDVGENVRQVSRAFGDWGIATENQSLALDKMFRAAQSAGTTVAALDQTLVQFGAPLRSLGVGFDEALALLAKFEREGVNTETVLGTMRIALAKMAEVGLDPAETFGRLIATIRDMDDPLEATALAMDVFGKRGGADMAAAIREGRFAIAEMVEDLQDAGGAIADTAAKTDDAKQQMETAFNDLKVAGQPVVTTVFEAMNKALTDLIPKTKEFADNLRNIAELFKQIGSGQMSGGDVVGAATKGLINSTPLGFAAGLTGHDLADMLGQGAAAAGGALDAAGRNLPGAAEAENRRIAEENWQAWADAQKAAAGNAADEVGDAVEAASAAAAPKPLTAEEIARLRKDQETAREEARIAREAAREQAAAVREAERIMAEQQRQAERAAENEARRINTIRELGEKRAEALDEADRALQETQGKISERADQQIADAQEQFDREAAIAEQRKQLQEDFATSLRNQQDIQGGIGLGIQQTRGFEDLDRRRAREDEDLAQRRQQQTRASVDAERQGQEAINAARFAGDSRAVTAAMLAAQHAREAREAQLGDEETALAKRRQREDEDRRITAERQADDLLRARANAAEIKKLTEDLSKPTEAFNQKILEDNLDRKIIDYLKAKQDAIDAANHTFDQSTQRVEGQFQQGVERANDIGLTQQVILNNYNNGIQGETTIEDMVEDLLEEASLRLAHRG